VIVSGVQNSSVQTIPLAASRLLDEVGGNGAGIGPRHRKCKLQKLIYGGKSTIHGASASSEFGDMQSAPYPRNREQNPYFT
jgi:hypothetical protein